MNRRGIDMRHITDRVNLVDGVAYLRVSSKEQQEGFSIPAQRKLYTEYRKSNLINVIDEFVDIESAKKIWQKKLLPHGRLSYRKYECPCDTRRES